MTKRSANRYGPGYKPLLRGTHGHSLPPVCPSLLTLLSRFLFLPGLLSLSLPLSRQAGWQITLLHDTTALGTTTRVPESSRYLPTYLPTYEYHTASDLVRSLACTYVLSAGHTHTLAQGATAKHR